MSNPADIQAVENFREYLRIPSVHPNVDYDDCVKFLQKQATSLDLPISVHHIVPKKPVVVLTWLGTQPTLPSILLNSHMDVVAVVEEEWTHKPFSAHIDEHNDIYGRGAQDMKNVGIQYLEAIRRLKKDEVVLKRTLHLSFVPDEEIGGADGMKQFVQTKEFQNLNVGFALDEGVASIEDKFIVFNSERFVSQLHIHCPGTPGHGSLLLENTAGEKVQYILNKFYQFRNREVQKLKNNPDDWRWGKITSINLTKIKGGVQTNVVPPELIITFDCRFPPEFDFQRWEEMVNQWCKEAGPGVWIEYEQKGAPSKPTKLDNSNPYWVAFISICDKLGMELYPQVCFAMTDMRFVRNLGIPALGFSPLNKTPELVHATDERLNVDTFLNGIGIYCHILTTLGNLEK